MIFKEGTIIRCIRSSGNDCQGVLGQLAIVTREIDLSEGCEYEGPWMKFLSCNKSQARHDLEERSLAANRFEKINLDFARASAILVLEDSVWLMADYCHDKQTKEING